MKKRIIKLLLVVCLICSVALAVTACKGVKMTISFMVDGKEYATINTSGNEIVTIPQSPTKDDYTFDGWFWDDGTWQRPFTASSLLNEPLTSNMSVYAKFTEIHKHTYSAEWLKDERGHWHVATCEHTGETTAIEPHTYDSNYKCKICGYQDTSLHGTEIATEVFDVDGETLHAKTPNSQSTFSFINAIQVADGATFVVATDLAASNIIRTKTVSLNEGDNTYYILVENGNDIQLYTVTLRRRPIYAVTFVTNGGTSCDSQQVEEDSLAIKPTTSKTGYTFANWDYDFATPVTKNTTITVSWTANKYNVTYDVNGGILTDTKYTATYGSAYTLVVPTKEGHTFQGWYIDETQIADINGQSIVNWTYTENKTATAKWTINSYAISLTVNDNNAGTVLGSGTYQFGDSTTITSTTNDGYNFLGWYDNDDSLISTNATYTFIVRSNASYTAKYNYYTLTAYGYNNTKISVGTEITLVAPDECIGYDWFGWYDGDELLTTEKIYTFTMPARNLTYTAKREVWQEMANFNFMSTLTNCTITGVIDRTVTEIVIPDYITGINNYAFNNWSNLITVTWNATACTKAGDSFNPIFKSCTNLTTVVIGENVTTIPNYAFYGCDSLTNINYLGTIESWCNIQGLGSLMSHGTSSKTFSVNGEPITELVIPDTVTSIPYQAFYKTNITNVTIGNSVTSICGAAFSDCSLLANINYLGTIESWCNIQGLGSLMSYGTSSKTFSVNGEPITELVIPDTVTSIPSYAFYKTGITNLTFEENSQCTSIGQSAFSSCSNLTSLTIGNGVTSIDSDAFRNCSELTSVTIPDSVTSIGWCSFSGCSNLTSITIGDGITSIDRSAFSGCSSLSNINYLGTIEYWCSIQELDGLMLYGTNSKTLVMDGQEITGELVIPNTVTSIPSYAFYKTDITNLMFEENSQCTSIGERSFYNCSSLESVTIGGDIISIDRYAFYNCSNLINLTIGTKVTKIGFESFYDCRLLSNINYLGTVESWCNIQGLSELMRYGASDKSFSINGKAITELVIPATVTSIPSCAFYKTNITSVTIGNSVTSIGNLVFGWCSNLTVYCEATSKPDAWQNNWADGVKEVIWGINNNR